MLQRCLSTCLTTSTPKIGPKMQNNIGRQSVNKSESMKITKGIAQDNSEILARVLVSRVDRGAPRR